MIDIELMACSGIRRRSLISLLSGPKGIAELSGSSGSSKTNTLHAIGPLIEAGIVAKKDAAYSLSQFGRAHVLLMQNVLDGIEVLQSDFWKNHDLSSIPDHLLAQVHMLKGGYVVEPNHDILKAQRNFIHVVTNAKEIYGVSSVCYQDWPPMILEALRNGAKAHLILSPDTKKSPPTRRYGKRHHRRST